MSNLKRAAYLGPYRQYMNPYTELVLACLHGTFRIDYFGPGFSLQLNDFVSASTKYEYVILDSMTIESEKFLASNHPFGGAYSHVSKSDLDTYLNSVQPVLSASPAQKIFIANFDTYATDPRLVDRLEELDALTLSMTDLNTTKPYKSYQEERKLSEKERFGHRQATDVWYDYVTRRKDRIVSVPHFVAMHEFDFRDRSARAAIIDIPGIGYEDRQKYKRLLNRRDRFNYRIETVKSKTHLLLNKLNGRFTQKQLYNFRNSFLDRLGNSQCNITTGGPMKYPVRKFYEIPARNAAMICEIFHGAAHHGFEEGQNYIAASEDSIANAYDRASKETNVFANVRCAAMALIRNKHSLPARQRQISSSLDLILQGTFCGSVWQDGEYLNL